MTTSTALLFGAALFGVVGLCAFIGGIMWELQRVQCPNCKRCWVRCDLQAERICPRCGTKIR